MESALSLAMKNLNDEYAGWLNDFEGDQLERYEAEMDFSDRASEIDKDFPSVLRSTSFGYAFSLLETALLDLSNRLVGWGIGQRKDRGFAGSEKHLRGVLASSGLWQSKDWGAITRFKALRDCLQHTNGKVSAMNNANAIRRIVTNYSNSGLSIDSKDRLQFDLIFIIREVIGTATRVLFLLDEALGAHLG